MDRTFPCRQCSHDKLWDEFKYDAGFGGFGGIILHPICLECRRSNVAKWPESPHFSDKVEQFWTDAYRVLRCSARPRRMIVAIGRDDLIQMYLDQKGRCALTGAPLVPEFGIAKKNNMRPSVDRIDSSLNYTLDNVHIVAAIVNIMKNDMTRDQFVMWCRRVVEHEADRQDQLLEAIG